ncbi:hypothetical protein [Mycobacterium intracellulare]|uniref:hypothetical protein n=1 Tax=Mycobacterium intracellulare TaxID=1767 RepID=UPI001E3B6FDE|nr:hypothetical protein [Mycobacterium intracellulare]
MPLPHRHDFVEPSCPRRGLQDSHKPWINQTGSGQQHNLKLTEAVVRAFVIAGTDEALVAQHAADVIESMLARALGGGAPGTYERQVAGVIADIWLANLMAFVGGRVTAEGARDRIDAAMQRVLAVWPSAANL